MYPMKLQGHTRPVTVVKLNYDGDLLFTASADPIINLWEANSGEKIGSYLPKSSVKSMTID